MKLLFMLAVLALPAASKKELTWNPAVVESSSRQLYNGAGAGPYGEPTVQTVRESIYIDAGEWLYHVTQIVTVRGALNLREGASVEVAEDGKHLIIRAAGKEHKLKIEERSRGKKGKLIR